MSKDRVANRLLVQPTVAIGSATILSAIIAVLWFLRPVTALSASLRAQLVMTVVLMGALYLSKHYPVHIRFGQKLEVGSISLYLLAILLPSVLAVAAVVVSILAAEISMKQVRGLYWSDIITQACRLGGATLAASLVAHVANLGASESAPLGPQGALFVGAALTLQARQPTCSLFEQLRRMLPPPVGAGVSFP